MFLGKQKRGKNQFKLEEKHKSQSGSHIKPTQYSPLGKCPSEAAGVVYVNNASDTVQHDLETADPKKSV